MKILSSIEALLLKKHPLVVLDYAPVINHRATSEKVRQWRTDCKLSQGDIAKQLGVSRCHLSFLETGHRQWSPNLLNRLTEIANMYRSR